MNKRNIILLSLAIILVLGTYISYIDAQDRSLSLSQDKSTILLVEATHLDESQQIVSDIFSKVSNLDDIWSEPINSNEYIRLKFEQPLFFKNDITIYPRIVSGNPKITIYASNESRPIAVFTDLQESKYNKVILESLEQPEDSFYLLVENGSVEFDHILDPSRTTIVPTANSQNTTQGQLTENTYTFSGAQTVISSSCYTNISLADKNNCTQAGTAALDAYFLMNVTLPTYSSIQNITIKALASNTAGLDKLNLSLFNYSAGAWRSVSATAAAPTANAMQTLTAVINTTSMQLTNFVSGQSMRIMVKGEGGSSDNLKLDYLEAIVTYTLNYSTNLTDRISFTVNQTKLGLYRKSLADTSSVTGTTSRGAAATTGISQLFNFNSNQGKSTYVQKTISQSSSFTGIAGRLGNLFKLPTDLFNFNFGASRTYFTSRSTSQSFILNSITARLSNLIRAPFGFLNFNSSILERLGFVRSPTSQASLSPTTTRFFGVSRTQATSISFSSISSRITGLFRISSQKFTLSSLTTRFFGVSRTAAQTTSFNSAASRVATFLKIPFQLFNFNSQSSKNSLFTRSSNQQLSLNSLVSRLSALIRGPKGSFTLQAASNSVTGFTRSSRQTIPVSSYATRLSNIVRIPFQALNLNVLGERASIFIKYLANIVDSLNLNNLVSRLSNLFKTPIQSASFTSQSSRTYFTIRANSQSLSFNSLAVRFSNLFRIQSAIVNFNSAIYQRLGLTRFTNSQFTLSPITGRITGFNRAQTSSISLNAVTLRLANFLKLPSQIFNFHSQSSRIFGVTRSTSQPLTINSLVSKLSSLFRSSSQPLTINQLAAKMSALFRSTSNSLNFNTFADRLASLFRRQSDTANFNSQSSRIFGVTRSSSQGLSFNVLTSRLSNLLRNPNQVLSIQTFGARLGVLTRFTIEVADRLGIISSVNKIAGLFRSLSEGFQYLFNLITGQEIESQSTSSSSSSGGNSGSTSIQSSTISTSGLSIIPDKLSVSIRQGEVKTSKVIIKNTGNSLKHLELSVKGLEKFIKLEDTSLDILPGESITVPVTFLATEDVPINLYLGKIIIESAGSKDEVLVAISVSSKSPLFDVKVSIPSNFLKVSPGADLLSEISVFNLGQIGTVDVDVEYELRNESGQSILSEEETIAVETHTSFVKNFKLPANVQTGNYLLYVKTTYNTGGTRSIATASAWFTIESKSSQYIKLAATTAGISALVILIVWLYLRHKRINRHKHENKKYSLRYRVINRSLRFKSRVVERIHHKFMHRIHAAKAKKV